MIHSQIENKEEFKNRRFVTGKRAAREILLLGTTTSLSPDNLKRLSKILAGNVNWEYLLDLAKYHGVAPLLAHNLTRFNLTDKVPEIYAERLNRIYSDNIHRSIFLSDELTRILSIFNQNDIDVITLKGTVLGEQLYVNPGLRTTNDIDVLVQPDKVIQASSLLEGMDYTRYIMPKKPLHPFHRIYIKKARFPFIVELHWDLHDPKLEVVKREEIWRRARQYQYQGGNTMVPSPEDTLLYIATKLLVHDEKHFKHLVDINEIIRKYRNNLDWDYIVRTEKSLGITAIIYYALKWAQELLEAPVPESVMKALKPSLTRRCLISWLTYHRILISPEGWTKINNEIKTLAYSLMMGKRRQAFVVMAQYRGYDKRAIWLRTLAWIPLVLGATIWINFLNLYAGKS